MAILKKSVLWYGHRGQDSAVEITDVESITVRKGLDNRSNTVTVKTTNANNLIIGLSPNTNIIGNHVLSSITPQFQELDVLKVFLRHDDDGGDIDTSLNTDLITSSDVLGISCEVSDTDNFMSVEGTDKTFKLLNRIWSQPFLASSAKNSPEILQSIIRQVADLQSQNMGFNSSGVLVALGTSAIDARLFSEGIKETGSATSTSTGKLVDSAATFVTLSVAVGDMVRNSTASPDEYAKVVSVDSETTLTLSNDIMVSGESYQVGDGFIQDTRIDGSVFPDILFVKNEAPVYEWVEELSGTINTNTAAEMGATPVQNRKMYYYLDERNRFHWEYPQNLPDRVFNLGTITSSTATGTTASKLVDTSQSFLTVGRVKVDDVLENTTDGTRTFITAIDSATVLSLQNDIVVSGEKYRILDGQEIKGARVEKKTFDIVNHVIYNCGPDLYGIGIKNHYFDATTTSNEVLDKFMPYTQISRELIEQEIVAANLVLSNPNGEFTYSKGAGGSNNRYTNRAYNFTPTWGGSAVTTDDSYNDSLRTECERIGRGLAVALTARTGHPRWKGSITLKGSNIVPGILGEFYVPSIGLWKVLLRIKTVTQQVSGKGWTTTLEVEEDEKRIGE